MKNSILITGATGALGGMVTEKLLDNGVEDLAVLVRDPEKATDLKEKGVEIRVGNYEDKESLLAAFKGIDKLYFVSGSEIQNRTPLHLNVVNSAKEAGVKYIVYTSFQRKNETESSPIAAVAESHLKTEKAILESGMNYTLLQHGIYMDLLPAFMGEKVLETGTIYLPAGDAPVSFTLREDMANVAVEVLSGEGYENKEFVINNEEALSFEEIAKILTEITGKNISYHSPSEEEYLQALKNAGVTDEFAGMFAGFAGAFKEGEFTDTYQNIFKITGKKPVSVREFLSRVYSNN
ncbi:SDR family oxidoreductase [Echinicola jeungdonensis]|uniref:SDR family oxidoreductase n=1 Tax=Echinicola jeungdonensis TaxID=709343 RepID=A0ABV5J9F9_9BACT|nr:SDR family oxidoreductase [Echinicola jeungdonensis]MDN3669072.1 SDR family oxidoreductase [Echinicola jeungdonensis]